ncbi:MAG: ABC transporter permease [Actinomycetota bacterium]|nr:ABC transporter permease [Actinomycetota bacterium]
MAQRVLFPAPLGVLVQGLVLGGLTALIAFGIALVYRAEGVVNFAQGDLGGLPASLAVLLILVTQVPYGLALGAGLISAVLLGALVHFLVIRRFAKAPRLILTVATVFLAQVLAAGEVVLPRAFNVTGVPQSFPSPFDFSFSIGRVVFSGNEVVAMAAIPVVLAGLAGFLRYTALGTAVRASAENPERAALLGVPVERVRATVWILATLLSTLAIFLRAGVVGLPIGRVLGPTILLRALAGAVVGRMERFPVILVASLGLGMLETAVLWDSGRDNLVPPVLFVVLLVALLAQRRDPRTLGRAAGVLRSSWPAVRAIRPVPRALARLPEVRLARLATVVVPVGVFAALPLVLPESRLSLLARVAVLAIVGVSLVVLTGWGGQVSLGQMAFAGIGAAVAGAATANLGWDLTLALLAAGVVGAAAATVIGLPALRIPGLLFAVTTLALAMATSSWFLNPEFMPWLPTGRIERPDLFGRVAIRSETAYYYVALAGLGLALLAARNLRRARTGRVLIGTRDNEAAAAAFGVNATRAKLTAFAASGFLAAFAGGLYVHHQQSLGITPYQPEESLRVFAMVVIGGLGSLPGALVGAAYVQGLDSFRAEFPRALQPFVALLGTGLGGLVVLTVLPGGLGGLIYAGRDRALRWAARRRGPGLGVSPKETEA